MFVLFFLIISGATPIFSVAETTEYSLGEIVVTNKAPVVESIGTTHHIDADEIRMRGAQTLSEALELVPGITIRTGADGVARVDIRGMRTRHVTLLIDGVPFNSTFDGQFDPTFIPVENIARIKVSKGVHSVLYGDGGLAGVINIVT